jgi:hypothetical protein
MEWNTEGGDGLTGTVLTSSLSQSWRICDEGHGVGPIDETENAFKARGYHQGRDG